MVQFYFLSVLLNILTGVILISSNNSTELDSGDFDFDDNKAKGKIKEMQDALENDSILTNETFCLVAGALCALVGFIKLFFAFSKKGNGVPVLGDLFPSVLGLVGGITVVLEYYSKSFADHDFPDFVEAVLFNNKKYIGCVCIIAGILHFIIPGFVFF